MSHRYSIMLFLWLCPGTHCCDNKNLKSRETFQTHYELIFFFKKMMAKTCAERVPEARDRLCCVWAHRAQPSLCRHLASCPGVQLGPQMRPEDGEKTNLHSSCPPLQGRAHSYHRLGHGARLQSHSCVSSPQSRSEGTVQYRGHPS